MLRYDSLVVAAGCTDAYFGGMTNGRCSRRA